MKIKLALLSSDTNYLARITSVFANKYADKLEVCSFSDPAMAVAGMAEKNTNVFISDTGFDIEISRLPKRCGQAYFVESSDIESYKGKPAVCKYQKIEIIYKTILEIFSDTVSDAIGIRMDPESKVRCIAFTSAGGGSGVSVSAVACSKALAASGKKTLYLNLETLGALESLLQGGGTADFGDVIFAVKSKKLNMSFKLESSVRQDASGVFFYAPPKTALDATSLGQEEIRRLLTDLKLMGAYEYIVIDMNFSLDDFSLEVLRQSTDIVFVADGLAISNEKFQKAYRAFEILDNQYDTALTPRVSLFYNKFDNRTGQALDGGIRHIGWAPPYEGASGQQVVEHLVGLGVFNALQ